MQETSDPVLPDAGTTAETAPGDKDGPGVFRQSPTKVLRARFVQTYEKFFLVRFTHTTWMVSQLLTSAGW